MRELTPTQRAFIAAQEQAVLWQAPNQSGKTTALVQCVQRHIEEHGDGAAVIVLSWMPEQWSRQCRALPESTSSREDVQCIYQPLKGSHRRIAPKRGPSTLLILDGLPASEAVFDILCEAFNRNVTVRMAYTPWVRRYQPSVEAYLYGLEKLQRVRVIRGGGVVSGWPGEQVVFPEKEAAARLEGKWPYEVK